MSAGSRSIRHVRAAPPPAPPARIDLPRVVSAAVVMVLVATALAPAATFAGTRDWSLSRTPASVTGPSSSVQVTATNTGDDGGGEAVGCVIVAIPTVGFTVTGTSIDVVSDGDAWSTSYFVVGPNTLVKIYSNSGGGNRLHADPSEWVRATISFNTTGSDGTYSWVGNAYNKENCTDDFLLPRTLLVTVNGAAPNAVPVAVADDYSTPKNTALTDSAPGVLGNDTDADGDPLTATPVGVQATSNGSVNLAADGSFTYTPNPGFGGTDTFSYQAADALSTSAAVFVTITVTDASPIGVPDPSYLATKNTPLSVAAPGVLSNDTDPDGDPLTATPTGVRVTTSGSVNLAADGSFVYTPNLGFTGVDTFTYRASDATSESLDTLVTIMVANTAPVALPDGPYAATEDETLNVAAPGVLANDVDADLDPLTAVLVVQATKGVVTLNANGSFTYVPVANATGTDSFTYQASDGSGASAVTTVSVTISPVNDAPVAIADAATTPEDTTLVIPAPGLLANDSDVEGDPLSAILVTAPASGTLALNSDGSYSFVPSAQMHGQVTFTYRASDGVSSSPPAVVTITVTPVNDAPTAMADSATSTHASPVTIDVLANDSDVDGDSLAIASVTQPTDGAVAVTGGTVRYTPPGDFVGVTTFTYTLTDGSLTDTATVTVAVQPPLPNPNPTPPPTPQPTPTLQPPATPAPTREPTSSSTPDATPAPSATPSATPEPVPVPRRDPPAAAPAAPAAPETLPVLTQGQMSATRLPAPPSSFGGFGGLFGGFSGGFAWAVPAAMLGVPGVLFMTAVAGQVLGAAAWIPAVRRSLAGVGIRRRRRAAAET